MSTTLISADQLSADDFERLAAFIQEYSGIKMPASKKTMVEGRLRRRIRAVGLETFADYCCYLFNEGGLADETVPLIDAVTTNKTDFFREPTHFQYLAETAIPELWASNSISRHTPLKVWSAACSTGAEAYTMAMVLAEVARSLPDLRASILATDISMEVLKTAAQGIYPESFIEPIPMEMRRRYLLRSKTGRGDRVRIIPALRRCIEFGWINLIRQPYNVAEDMHIIFCRNVLIYFDKPTQAQVVAEFCRHLRPGGYLVLGHSENLPGTGLPLELVATTVFRRV
ncbi:MAG: CheR family methyltransferase [Alphaproteobacteria bacterium]